jgi:hypothetical protein
MTVIIHLQWEQVYRFSASNDDTKRECISTVTEINIWYQKEWHAYTLNRNQNLKCISGPFKTEKQVAWNIQMVKSVFYLEFSKEIPQFMTINTKIYWTLLMYEVIIMESSLIFF